MSKNLYANHLGYTDVNPFEIIKVISQKTKEKLVFAKSTEEARKIIIDWLKEWYDDEDVEPMANDKGEIEDYEFFCGTLSVRLKGITETTVKEFKDELYKMALIP